MGWGRSCQCAHAHSVGNTIENGQLCRAVQKASWTRPLGTTAGVPEDSPGDCRTGRLPLTGVNSESFPGDNLLLKPRRKQRRERSTNPLLLPSPSPSPLLSAPQERHRDISNVAAKRLGFIPVVRLFVPTVNKTAQRQKATTAGFTMVLLAVRSRRCLNSCCMGTLCLQLLLWILCAVNGEEQPFSVEVRAGTVIC